MKENINLQGYRDNLAANLKEIRKTDPEEARSVLEEEKQTTEYKEAENIHSEERNETLLKAIEKEYILENYLNNKPKLPENIKSLDQLFEKIKTPEELLEYMDKNLSYGYVGRENNKVYSPGDINFDDDFNNEYFLQTPEQLLNSKRGVCWDQAELERSWFSKNEYESKVYFLMFAKEELNNLPTHTFLVYKNDDKFYWFENSFGSQKGIHEYKDLDDLIEDVKRKQLDYAKNDRGATDDDFKDIKICEYELPKFGCNPDEFINNILDKNSEKNIMIGESNFSNLSKVNDIPLKKEYSEDEIAEKLSQGVDLDNDFALYLLKSEKSELLFDNIEKFQNLDSQEIALKLIESGYAEDLAKDIDYFRGLNQEVALKLIEAGHEISVSHSLESFEDLDQEIVLKLIRCAEGYSVINNLEKFQGLDYKEIALQLIKSHQSHILFNNLEKFQGLDYKEIVLQLIESGDGDMIIDNLVKFQISPQKLYQAIKEKYSNFINEVETKIPKLADQLAKSLELLLDILNIKDDFSKLEKSIAENPFLLDALEENPRYGSKLILKYQEFDETAKNNIQELFNNEAGILKENPNLDKDSVEFRSLMQEKLTSHANNKEILEELENNGVNTKEWLDYDKQTYFTLGESEDVKFSDQIKTPITRIKETLNKYQDSIVNVLSDYKTELQEAFIPNSESEELKQKIAEQKARIASETDDNRIQGMQRGLSSLEAKEAALKSASVWTKVQSDIFRLKSMIDNIFKFHNVCVETETKIETIKDRKELIKEKDNLEKNKTQLRDNFKDFESFFESYETKLQELIIPSLGQERSEALLQEIKGTIGEELNHYNTDKNTLKNIFSEKDEDENKLNDREMKISISSRSTQDLYLGNYCPCCICINSDFHGAESPIADYVTDLGMQNIVVYDEKTNSPVVVCWTFIGENKDYGSPVMVIDNIEANTDYTNKYPDQLKEIISKYINDYAKSVNIRYVIQGEHNNDLLVFDLEDIGRKFGGKYNRAGGYFLESESDEEFIDEYWTDDDDV